jgi:hypothetical protein
MKKQQRVADLALAEPGDDWVPISVAPFFYAGSYYLSTLDQWRSHLEDLLPLILGNVAFTLSVSEDRVASIKALDCELEVHPWSGAFWLATCDNEDLPSVLVFGPPDVFFSKLETRSVPRAFSKAIALHSELAARLVSHMQLQWSRAVQSGSARIMARASSPLTPFTPVTPDQWRYFRLDELPPRGEHSPVWCAPMLDEDYPEARQLTAIGPTGEKLFSLHAAPGARGELSRSPIDAERRCADWLLDLLAKHPDRRPDSRKKLASQALAKFNGLTERGFDRALQRAYEISENRTWQLPGRPKKSS